MSENSAARTVDEAEIARFDALADTWWDPDGPMRPLHLIGPVRLAFIRNMILRHFGADGGAPEPFAGLRILDVGCGAGLLDEPLARLGAQVTAIDAAAKNIAAARRHADGMGLKIDYRNATAEDLAAGKERFDVVMAMEVVEHVADLDAFLGALARLTKPGGLVLLSTINRTLKSFAMAIVGAEYVLRWLPRGTHDWQKFLKPEELQAALEEAGFVLVDREGMRYDPLGDRWSLDPDMSVNYLMAARKPKP